MSLIRVLLPAHLRALTGCPAEVSVSPAEPTLVGVLDALEALYPSLGGTLRDRRTGRRRDFVRFFACETDLSHDPVDDPLPAPVQDGREPLLVVGAMAGG